MRQFAVITILVVCVALGLSFLLLPSEKEVGTMLLRDRQYEESRRYFEAQIAAGDTSPQVVTALLEIYIRDGDVNRAIALVGSYEAAAGTEPAILARLAELYRQDRRFGLYLQTLERLTAIDPTLARLEELADAYYKAGDAEKRLAALERLRNFEGVPVYRLLELSDMQVATGRYAEALDTLTALLASTPDALDRSYRWQIVDLALYLGDREKASRFIDSVLALGDDADTVVSLADTALYRRAPDLALALLQRYADLERSNAGWRRVHAAALGAVGRNDEAYEKLTAWWEADALPPASAGPLLDLAVQRGNLQLALAVFDRYGLAEIEDGSVLSLMGELHRAGRTEAVDALLAELGTDALNADPVLGAEIMLARNAPAAAARFADRALAAPAADPAGRIGLAVVLIQLDRAEDAFALLQPFIAAPGLPVEAALLLGELYVTLDRAEEGFWDVAALLAQQNTPRLRAIWAQLALATERRELVVDWLAREPDIATGAADDLYFLAERQQAWDVAVAAARRVAGQEPGDGAPRRLAYALFQRGDTEEALSVIEPIAARNQDAEPLYAEILRALGRTDRLAALWTRQLYREGLSAAEAETLVYSLIDIGADAAVWERLLELVTSEGGGWWYTAAGAADRLGRVTVLLERATAELAAVNPGSDEAVAIVYAIADLDRTAALPLFRDLAERAPAQWGEAYAGVLRELGRNAELVAWIEDRLARTDDGQQALALAYGLAELDPAAAAAAVAPRSTSSRTFADLYADLLRRAGRAGDALRFETRAAESGRFGAAYARDTAFRALEAGDRQTAENLFRLAAADAGPDSDSVRQLLYLWGPRPRPDALDWIEARARSAAGAERQRWLERLIDMRASRRVVAIIGGIDGAETGPELVALVRALALTSDRGADRQDLSDAIVKAVSRIDDPETLRDLARTAEGTRDRALIVTTWQAVLRAAPADREAQRTLGLIAYDEGRLIDAERLLGAYLANGDGDYEANYYFADTLARTARPAEAMPFYRRAHGQLTAIEPRDFTQEVLRANLLRRLGRTNDAVELMDALVRQRPEDDGLRADYADLLIEIGDLARARTILKLK